MPGAEGPQREGDGWVNWSGLATLLEDVAGTVAAMLVRLQAPVFVSSKAVWFAEEAAANGMFASQPTGKFLSYDLNSGKEIALSLPPGALPPGFSPLSISDVWPRPGT